MSERSLDLRGTPCPVNFIRCRLTLESLQSGASLEVRIDRGEPEAMVIPGLREAGHQVEVIAAEEESITLQIICRNGQGE